MVSKHKVSGLKLGNVRKGLSFQGSWVICMCIAAAKIVCNGSQ